MPTLVEQMNSTQKDYNETSDFVLSGEKKSSKIEIFADAAEHITRIARAIREEEDNALILGVKGAGKKSLSRLATYLSGYKLFEYEASEDK